MKKITGMIAAVPTPFYEDESINFDAFKQLIEFLIENGMHCLLIGGSTGEYSLMSKDERKSIIKTACKINAGRVKIIAGCSCARTFDTIEMVQFSESVGADAGLVLPPYYLHTSRQGIINYYKDVADSVKDFGIIIYHYPDATAVYLDPELIMELSKIMNVIAIKNTTEMDHTARLIEMAKDRNDFSVINGFENLILGTLALGGDGMMGIVHNLVPKQMVDIYNAMQANDVFKAREINNSLAALYNLMEEEPYPGPIKAALEIMGIHAGNPRKPIVPASTDMKRRLESEMKKIGII